MNESNLINRLNKHPHIKARLEVLLDVAENTSGEFKRADDAEAALIEGVRKMGCEFLQDWAMGQNALAEITARNDNGLKCHSKKNFIGDQRLGKLQ